ncbi:MAG: tetratricopeptide repeat protein [Myxococcales bacterium]|nr:tetratricopeptide repeat protein [Myxococcales bacterium]
MAVALVLAMAPAAGGCKEYSARSKVKEATTLHDEQKYKEAEALLDQAIAASPDLEIAHFNLGMVCYKQFRPGDTTPENKAMADKAAKHLQFYLDRHPSENQIRTIITKLWTGVGDYDKAIAYWEKEHAAAPQSREILSKLGAINFEAGRYEAAVGWFAKEADIAPDNGKVSAYLMIGRMAKARLRDIAKVVGDERIANADLALGYLIAGTQIEPKNVELVGTLGNLYAFRGASHGPSWAMAIDVAESEIYMGRWRVLFGEAAKAAKAAEAAAAAKPTP